MTDRRSFLHTCLSALGAAAVAPLARLSTASPKRGLTPPGAVNVLDFGAKCDGVTDDTDAIQAAVDYVGRPGGGVVYFPPGVCRVCSPTKSLRIHDRQLVIDGCLDIRSSSNVCLAHSSLEPGPVRKNGKETANCAGIGCGPYENYVDCLIRISEL